MLDLIFLLNTVLHKSGDFCCFCFKDIKDDKFCQIKDEVTLNNTKSKIMQEILSDILGAQCQHENNVTPSLLVGSVRTSYGIKQTTVLCCYSNKFYCNLPSVEIMANSYFLRRRSVYISGLPQTDDKILDKLTTGIMCMQCSELAIKCYTFITTCHNNIQFLNTAITALQNHSKMTGPENNRAKSLFLIIKDQTVNGYYDTKHIAKKSSVLLGRLQYITQKAQEKCRYTIPNNFIINLGFEDYENNTILSKENAVKRRKNKKCKLKELSEIIYDINNFNDLKCKTCLNVYSTLWNLEQHYFTVHAPKVYKCPECSRNFSTSPLLERHKRNCHCSVVCSQCGKIYTNIYSLRRHEKSHKQSFICQMCGKFYKGKQSYNNHIKLKLCEKIRKSNAEAKFICNYCEKKYSTKVGLHSHIQLEHENGKALLCQWCNKKFSSVSRLREHSVKHTKDKNFTCEFCCGKFVTKTSLLYHTRIHTGEKPYQCDLCDKRFISVSRRTVHVKKHHASPNLECKVCQNKFKSRSSFLKHKKKHILNT